jgi:hypothetical protein
VGPVVSGGGVLVVLDELDELDDVVLDELKDEVDDFEVLDELVVGEVLVGAVGTAVPVGVAVGRRSPWRPEWSQPSARSPRG